MIRHPVEGEHRRPSGARQRRRGAQVGQIPGGAAHPGAGDQQRMVGLRLVGAPERAVDVIGTLRAHSPPREAVALGRQRLHRGAVMVAAGIGIGHRAVDAAGGAAPLHLFQIADELLPRLLGHVHVAAVVIAYLEAGGMQLRNFAPVQVAALVAELQPLGDEESGAEPVTAQQRGREGGVRLLAVVEGEDDQALRHRLHRFRSTPGRYLGRRDGAWQAGGKPAGGGTRNFARAVSACQQTDSRPAAARVGRRYLRRRRRCATPGRSRGRRPAGRGTARESRAAAARSGPQK